MCSKYASRRPSVLSRAVQNLRCCPTVMLQATQLRPEWSKAHYRLARAHRLAGETEEYIAELWQALRFDQSNEQIR